MEQYKNILKNITILYAEDSKIMRMQTVSFLKEYCQNIIVACDGQEAFAQYQKHHNKIDIILSDIVMPNMTGMELVSKIRETDQEIPCVLATSIIDKDVFIEAIRLHISGYAIKPINFDELLKTLSSIAKTVYAKKSIVSKDKTLTEYVDAINGVAIVTKTDLKGDIIYTNKMFSDISGYSFSEIMGSPQNIVRHPDVDKKVYQDMWKQIQSGNSWQGTIKNKAKDGTAYFVKSYIFPLFDEFTNIKEYMAIRVLVTDEENKHREFQKNVVETLTKNRISEAQLKKDKSKLLEQNKTLKVSSLLDDDNHKIIKLELELIKAKKLSTKYLRILEKNGLDYGL